MYKTDVGDVKERPDFGDKQVSGLEMEKLCKCDIYEWNKKYKNKQFIFIFLNRYSRIGY